MIESDYKPHPVLYFDPDYLMTVTLEKIQEANPNIKIGEKAHGGQRVWQGKVVPTYLQPDNMSLDYDIPHVERPYVEAYSTQSVKIYFQGPNGFDIFKGFSGYLHPISVGIKHTNWLINKKPGDVVRLTDSEYDTSEHTLTQDDFDKHSYVTFYFALSDQ